MTSSRSLAFRRCNRAGLRTLIVLWGIMTAPLAHSATAYVAQTLNAQLAAIGKVSVPGSISLAATGTVFNTYSNSLTISYRIRSTGTGTGGTITVKASADFSPGGGPAVSNNTFNYTCSGASLGTPCSGTQTVSLSAATSVLTIPAGVCTGGGAPCSSADPNTESISLTLANDPGYQTGTYSATLLFTISST
jgi:hypothetical protein